MSAESREAARRPVSAARKICVLCAKDFADVVKNPTMLVFCLFPLAFMFLYRFMLGGAQIDGADEAARMLNLFLLATALSFSSAMVTSMTVVYGIAEEKEKRTLRTLMLANVSGGQILVSRSILSLACTLASELACFAVLGADWKLLPAYLLFGLLGAVPVVLVSLVVGMASRDQMTAGLYGMPVMLVCLLPLAYVAGGPFSTVALFAPNGGAAVLCLLMAQGTLSFGTALWPVVSFAVWVVLGAVVFALLYKRLLRDN